MRHDPAGAAIVIMLRSLKMRHARGVLPARRMTVSRGNLNGRTVQLICITHCVRVQEAAAMALPAQVERLLEAA